jgi:hypothetical protein
MLKTPISTKATFELSVADLTALLNEPFKTVELEVTEMLDMLVALTATENND